MLGDCGAGKTAMAAGLAVLSEKSSADRTFFPLDNDTKQQFEKWRNTLRNGTWPEKTSVNTTLRFAAVKGGDHINVELSDFPGEHFLDAMQRGCIGKEAEQFQKSVKCADVLMLLLDGEKLQRDREKVLLDLPRVALKQAVFEARANRDKPARHRIDIVVVITKADLCDVPRTPKSIRNKVNELTPDLSRYLRELNAPTAWLALSACGGSGSKDRSVPSYDLIEPEGYEELFRAFGRRRDRSSGTRKPLILYAVLTLVLFVVFAYAGYSSFVLHQLRQIKAAPTLAQIPTGVAEENLEPLRKKFQEFLAKIRDKVESAANTDGLDQAEEQIDSISEELKQQFMEEIGDLTKRLDDCRQAIMRQSVLDCEKRPELDCRKLIEDYAKRYPKGLYAEEMRNRLQSLDLSNIQDARRSIGLLSVDSDIGLKKKKDCIERFLGDYGKSLSQAERQQILRALELAKMFLELNSYSLKIVNTSGLDSARKHSVQVWSAAKKSYETQVSDSVSAMTWNEEFSIQWKAGQTLGIVLQNHTWRDQEIARFESDRPVAIADILDPSIAPIYEKSEVYFGTDFSVLKPPVQVRVTCEEISHQDIEVVRDYLMPGKKWCVP
ncbi:MAG: TRAFAC clade GTPase domain-containing protein [Planctomyces sp.]|jgi:hypothetical protein